MQRIKRMPKPQNLSEGRMKKLGQKGFTLIELMIVITIILLLLSLMSVFIARIVEDSRYRHTRGLIAALDLACVTYRLENGEYPPDNMGDSRTLHYNLGRERFAPTRYRSTGGGANRRKPPIMEFSLEQLRYDGDGPIDADTQAYPIQDAWQNPLLYKYPGQWNVKGCDIWSNGKDEVPQLDPEATDFDDVTNWQRDF